jgi:hypothetical protein
MRYLFSKDLRKIGTVIFSVQNHSHFERICARRRKDCTEARALTDDGIVRNGWQRGGTMGECLVSNHGAAAARMHVISVDAREVILEKAAFGLLKANEQEMRRRQSE